MRVRGGCGAGGIAVSADGTLGAYAKATASSHDGVQLYGTGSAQPSFECASPGQLCFARREGVQTLLVAADGDCRILEYTTSGERIRAISVAFARLTGIACAGNNIAVSGISYSYEDPDDDAGDEEGEVMLIDYTTSECIRMIGVGVLTQPSGLRFTSDGLHIVVADWYQGRVSKFSVIDGKFVSDVATGANGIFSPVDVLVEDGGGGGVVVACDGGGVVFVDACGVTLRTVVLLDNVVALAWYDDTVCSKVFGGEVHMIRSAWAVSLRCAWITACVCTV
jgi:hypothetical protein